MNHITKQDVAKQINDYLHKRITLAELVDWAEAAMVDGDFAEDDYDTIRYVVARLGVADVRAFGLTWEDCQHYLSRLGYEAQISVMEIS